ncbi:MAG: glucose-6-phosphate isomerase [Candidatus Omnitrophica bacterium]|nr:glucose-6-phosphate isomerase [Candidatus Omnitrophota bacterium]
MSKDLSLDTRYMKGFVKPAEIKEIMPDVEKAHFMLEKKNGPGNGYLGWMDLPTGTCECLVREIEETAAHMRAISDAVIVVGIGGSYLGAKAAIEMLTPEFVGRKVFFAGHNLSASYLNGLLMSLKDKEVTVNVISKSGGTTEPAIAFRIIEAFVEKKYGKENAAKRIVCTTDAAKGTLKELADKRGYKTLVIPDDVGGRFSVLTPVGLLPIACAGIDIRELLGGAASARERSFSMDLEANPCYMYAALRNLLLRKGKKIEILSNFDGRFHYLAEWWKQLFGESEGKGGKGIFPAACDFTTDLHSIGQLIQDGERNIFETFLIAEKEDRDFVIPQSDDDLDNLNYLSGKSEGAINFKAYQAVAEAHFEGGVPNSSVIVDNISPRSLGQLFYFFEKAAAVSGYILGVNPFDQPGVEAYKKKMFKLLGKPGV